MQDHVLRAELAQPATLAQGDDHRFTADFDLDASLAGAVGSGDTVVTVELEDLVVGLPVFVPGGLSGPADDRSIDAASVRARPAWVDGADRVGCFEGAFGGGGPPRQ